MKNGKFRYIQLLAVAITSAFVLFSCDDFMDETPGNRFTPEQHYHSTEELNISIIGAFGILQETMPGLIVMDGMLSDMMAETDNFDRDIRELNRHTVSLDNKYIDPSAFYRIIINANEVLSHLDDVKKNDLSFNDQAYEFAIIDLVSLRSWAYFTLVRLFGEAAYIPDNITSYSGDYTFEYYTRERMIDTLLSQLDTLTYPNSLIGSQGTYYISDLALKGELYLEKGDYENAKIYLIKAIGAQFTKRFKVDGYLKEEWDNIHKNAAFQSGEVLSGIPFTYTDRQENPLSDLMFNDRDYLVKPSSLIIDLFESQVTKKNENGDLYRGSGISYAYAGPDSVLVINKYSLDPAEYSGADIIICRAADLHLLLAEALNRLGDTESALKIVNDGYASPLPGWKANKGIRGRVYLKSKAIDTMALNVIEYVEDIIMEERAMELAFEGKRWFDLVRVANRRGEAYLADRVAAKFAADPALADEVRNRLLNKGNWYLPLKK